MTNGTDRKPRIKKNIKTYWSGIVQTFGGVSSSTRGDSLSGLMSDAFRIGAYYLAQGYRVEITHIERCCSECWGTGSVTPQSGRHAFQARTCPECKGHAVFEALPDFPLILPSGVKIVSK